MTFKFYITHFTFCGFVVSNQIHINRIIPTVPIRVKKLSTPQLHTRLAPTPSGLLHPGNGLSFIMTWVIARANAGRILLRIDDIDKDRCREEYVVDIFQTLEWLGLDYDEGPSGVADFFPKLVAGDPARFVRKRAAGIATTRITICLYL